MQSPGGEGGGEDGREETLSEDGSGNVPPAQEVRNQDEQRYFFARVFLYFLLFY